MEPHTIDSIIAAMEKTLEEQAGRKIFTLRCLEQPNKDELEIIVVFEDKEILMGKITIPVSGDLLGIRIQGNYI